MIALLVAVFAGALTTIAGMGGGQVLLLALTVLWGPIPALIVTCPAMLLGNTHRLWLYRDQVQRDHAVPLILGLVPGALIGGLLITDIPKVFIEGLMVLLAGMAVFKVMSPQRWTLPELPMSPVGASVGALSAAGGGAGLMLGPVLLARGLSGVQYIATMTVCAISIHLGRGTGYWLAGELTVDRAVLGACLSLGVMLGNQLGHGLRPRIPEGWETRLQMGALLGCLAGVIVT